MDPSQVRKRILHEHRVIRDQLLELETELDKLAVDEQRLNSVILIARRLLVDLSAHTELEDAILAPALRELDAWGPVRAEMLLDHHSEQRQQFQELLAAYDKATDFDAIARMTFELAAEVRADMLREESSLLNENL